MYLSARSANKTQINFKIQEKQLKYSDNISVIIIYKNFEAYEQSVIIINSFDRLSIPLGLTCSLKDLVAILLR